MWPLRKKASEEENKGMTGKEKRRGDKAVQGQWQGFKAFVRRTSVGGLTFCHFCRRQGYKHTKTEKTHTPGAE